MNPTIQLTLVPDSEPAPSGAGTPAAYARVLRLLLPPGKLWTADADSWLGRLLLAAGDELARIEQRARDLRLRESMPGTAVELLPEHEEALGLPSTGTLEERQARAAAADVRRPRYRPEDFRQALAPYLGQDAGDVIVIERTSVEAAAMGDPREIFRFFIYRDPDAPGSADFAQAQAIVDRMKPSHTVGHVIASTGFLCDDPNSLCNRDILGA